jgi:hypothetical protein
MFHKLDSEDSEDTLRYKMGYVLYMMFFFLQSLMLLATYVLAWVLYIRLATFLKPNASSDEEGAENDDEFENPNKSDFEARRDTLRKNFKPKYY